jgi:hypothetical protein
MNRIAPPGRARLVLLLGALAAGAASAQDAGLSISVGARAWYTAWTTFGYYPGANPNLALTQTSGPSQWVLLPTASVRYGNFFASIGAFTATDFEFTDGSATKRSELDVNAGYSLMPGLNVALGYKKVAQRGGQFRYEPGGPVVGLNGNAAISGPWSLYGAVGVGRLKTSDDPNPAVVKFKATYRLTEVGLAYTLPGTGFVQRWTLTAGHRVQVIRSKEAFFSTATGQQQDGMDTTQGAAIGVLATF